MRHARAIVVDDNQELAENVREILEGLPDFDVKCVVARSRREALDVCSSRGGDFDLALIDLRLPDGDGLGLLPELRSHCPIAEAVIITGDATVETAAAAVGQGAFAYVIKPFRGQDLAQTASLALGRARLVREREELRRALEESEHRYRETVEAVPALVLALDAAGNIVLWNRRLEELTGYTRKEMLGRAGRELVGAGGDRKLFVKDDAFRIVRWQLAALEGSAIRYALGIDVTDERAMLRRTLRAERLAAVGTLAAGLAHEVRNPLNSALLQLKVLERRIERGEKELIPVVDVVRSEIQRLERLVNDFLAFAQPRPLELHPNALNDLVSGVVQQFRPEAEAADIEFQIELGPASTVEMDTERMRQVLINLVRNALEAMPTGGTLRLRTLPEDAQGNTCIQVEDTGPGFDEEAPVFDTFYTTKPGGTGLGLAIVHRIVQDHGGTVSADSRPGRTSFTIALPVQPAAPTAAPGAELGPLGKPRG